MERDADNLAELQSAIGRIYLQVCDVNLSDYESRASYRCFINVYIKTLLLLSSFIDLADDKPHQLQA